MSQVSITDLAAAAGVSPSTVSRALHDHPRISPARRKAIQALAEQMGYRPSQVARSLVTGRTGTLGVIVTDVTDAFVAEVMKGAEAAAREAGHTLLFATSGRDPGREIDAIRLLLDRQVDGMIVISGRAGPGYTSVRAAPTRQPAEWPLVLVNNEQPGAGIYSVRMDHRSAARGAVTYLRQLGHRRIAYVTGPAHGRSNRERLEGYRQGIAAREEGAPPAGEIIIAGNGLLEDGPIALVGLLALPVPPTAVLCYNDLAAIGLLAAAARAGVRVPDDLSVVGYDNIPLSAYSIPPLTTVDQPTDRLGRTAVAMCLDALAGRPVANVVLTGRLIIRESAQAASRASALS